MCVYILSTHDSVEAARGPGMKSVCQTLESQLKLAGY